MTLSTCRCVPESTRWLVTEKRYDEARTLIFESAKINKKTIPEHLLIIPKADENQVDFASVSLNMYLK